jgi:hypothetical protein
MSISVNPIAGSISANGEKDLDKIWKNHFNSPVLTNTDEVK